VVDTIRELAPDCIVVAAYGQIIPKSILDIPPKGIINVHGSLLPAYRGAAPIQWAIIRGETETGITTMLMDEGLDTGAILLQRKVAIAPHDTSESLEDKLSRVGAEILLETLDGWMAGRVTPVPQDDSQATLAPRIKQEDAGIDWIREASEIACRIRGFVPWPVAHTKFRGKLVKLWSAAIAPPGPPANASPGEIISVGPDGILVECGNQTRLRLMELQAEGKKRMGAAEYARGQRLVPGDRWENA
jgi:methionyl-tRNA formyltransferase